MSKELLFSIIFKNLNHDITFALNESTASVKKTGELLERFLNVIDEMTKSDEGISEGDVFQALSLTNSIRISISNFDNKKLLDFTHKTSIEGIRNFSNAKKTLIGNS